MRIRRSLAVCFAGLAATSAALAADAPKPGPGHQKLGYFVGKWTTEGEMQDSPLGPGGRMTANDTCEWFDGKFAVVCRSEGRGPQGPMKSLGILGYNPEENVYTYYGISNDGMAMLSIPRGTVEGNTWVYVDEARIGGQTIKNRYLMRQLSADAYEYRWEIEGDDGWMTILRGKSTRK